MNKNLHKPIGPYAQKLSTPRLQGSCNVFEALVLMDSKDYDIIAVMCEDAFAGTFSREDFKKMVLRQNLNPKTTSLYEVMHINPPYVNKDLSIADTYRAMLAYQWDYMPVLHGNELYGIVTIDELSVIKNDIDNDLVSVPLQAQPKPGLTQKQAWPEIAEFLAQQA